MIQKFVIGLTILLLSLAGLIGGFINVRAATRNELEAYTIVLAPPVKTFSSPATGELLVSQETVTQTNSYFLYLPTLSRKFCADSFNYDESIAYNLTKIRIEEGWQSCYQGQDITVAVIDTGIDLDHPDLLANLVDGKTFVFGTSIPDDDAGHGTHVAGIIAAVNNNGGVIGVAPKARLMPIKVLDEQGSGSIYNVAAGLEWAVDHGARVINLSLGSVSSSATLKEAVDYAYNKGVLVVAAGGNCGDAAYFLNGCYYQDQPVYPGAYPNVVAVAATDNNDNQASFSNQGYYIDIAAPGSAIYSTYPSGGYTTMSGASMATPHVAGLAALVWSKDSTLTNQAVWTQIRNTAQDLGTDGWDHQFGYGRIDAAAAMSGLQTTAVTLLLAESSPAGTETEALYVPGELLLKLQPGFTVNKVMDQSQLGAAEVRVADTIDQIGVQKLTVTRGQEQVLLTQLRSSSGVIYAELNYVVTIR